MFPALFGCLHPAADPHFLIFLPRHLKDFLEIMQEK
jgi:hypothetical protein